jgi:hypothetical protein
MSPRDSIRKINDKYCDHIIPYDEYVQQQNEEGNNHIERIMMILNLILRSRMGIQIITSCFGCNKNIQANSDSECKDYYLCHECKTFVSTLNEEQVRNWELHITSSR